MQFKSLCIHCGREAESENYVCHCDDEKSPWHERYRSIDLLPIWTEQERKAARKSFEAYSFDHPKGIVQYTGLPNRSFLPSVIEAVGMTPLYPLREMGETFGCQLYIKNEGDNPSGCFKDRETLMCLLHTLERRRDKAVIYSSGNAAASAALFAQKQRLKLVTFVAGDTYPGKIDFIRRHGSDVIVIGDEHTTFEEGFRFFAHLNAEEVFLGQGFDNWSVRNPYRVQGDKTTALEMVRQLEGKSPDYVVVPTGNGSCLAGIWKGFQELKELELIDRLPRMVSAGIAQASPVYVAVRREQTEKPVKLDLSELDEATAHIGSTIVAEEGYDAIEAARAVLESDGLAVQVAEEELRRTMRTFLDREKETSLQHAVLPEPASYISLSALEKVRQRVGLKPQEVVVSVITGHGMKAESLIDELLENREDLQDMAHQIIDEKQEEMPEDARRRGRRLDVPAEYEAIRRGFLKMSYSNITS